MCFGDDEVVEIVVVRVYWICCLIVVVDDEVVGVLSGCYEFEVGEEEVCVFDLFEVDVLFVDY